ncbi:MAG: helix-turn-helix transcriptional regulator [Ruminococcaceae bacterium]|nr:helix-turn-helix transcriptional regulator [Oscillospiraceae bacterium]
MGLRKLRTAAGFTQGELCSKINRGATSISKYESGAMQPTLETSVELAFPNLRKQIE